MFRNPPELSYEDLITGEKFVGICDAVWFHYEPRGFDPGATSTCFFYSDTEQVEELFERLPRSPDRQVVVVTHNADRGVTADMVDKLPPNVVAWYAQNVRHAHPKLHPIPIGLENERWFPEERKKLKILRSRAASVVPTKLLYMNHAIWTNVPVRQGPYQMFEGKPWCTAVHGKNGRNYDGYLSGIADHFYVLSPEGNGIDCHRTWEALYMNRVPILIRNANTRMYEDLPVLLVDDWSAVTEERLRDARDRFLEADYDFDKLKFAFWRSLVRGERGGA
jgi:hypothetical protein